MLHGGNQRGFYTNLNATTHARIRGHMCDKAIVT